MTDPKMPEPVALMDAAELRELTTCNSMRVQCGNPPVYDEITAKAEGLVPVVTTEFAQAYAEALAEARVAQAVAAKQAEIDRLMLEHCPGDMAAEQMAEWARSQRSIPVDMNQKLHENLFSLYIEDQPPETGKEPT